MSIKLSRRQAILSTASAPLLLSATSALASDEAPKPLPLGKARGFRIGELEGATLLAGTTPRPDPHTIFGLNVPAEEFAEVSAANFIPTDSAQFYFTPTVVKSGDEVILFDAGLNAAGTTAALAEAGISPEDITKVVITHMHGDHIGGLMNDGTPTYANAMYVTGQIEFDHWAAAGNERFDGMVKPLAEKMSFLGDGDAVAPGITAMAAFGHTPGHMTYMLDSGGKQLLLAADLANHYVWSLGYPDWEVKFDMDKTAAAGTRRKVLGMLAADRVPMVGYHMPFPGNGYVETRGDGFRFVPVSYQLL
ncbi:MBL fold metallo-hydrolase [Tropicimonas sp. TH_r6]|uniref:MBL fold metallo-hydrolase n=1 Tax=Tropicimonas sp. TH_r6 TaxID=3082085 RepID=UPI0029558380|nr:MBL fold metallo-hydrolase [Tropicimonas sp. TH_r6]MDV7144528.1 MBL fold metallo-hydrolase [Tropicimonas sp. TH_r6]